MQLQRDVLEEEEEITLLEKEKESLDARVASLADQQRETETQIGQVPKDTKERDPAMDAETSRFMPSPYPCRKSKS